MGFRLSWGTCSYLVVLFFAFFAWSQTTGADELQLDERFVDGRTSANEGHLTISWQHGTPPYRLTQVSGTSTGEPIILYEGSNQSYFMTGLLEGENRFVIEDSEEVSEELVVEVDYPNLTLVIGTLGLGTFLLLALITIVYMGNRRYV